MKDVRLAIAGREYTVACAPGEEPHIEMLGQIIDAKLSALPNIAGQADGRRFLYAALLLADELHERQPSQATAAAQTGGMTEAAEALEALADRLEVLAEELEAGRADQPGLDQPSPE